MELRQLEYVIAVARERSFTRAAEQLYVSQPGVSTQIRALERELGQSLFDRRGRSVVPTAAGEQILTRAREALAAVADMRRIADAYSGMLRGRLSVATVVSAAAGFDLVGALVGFHEQHPGIDISLVEARADQLREAVENGEVDIALVAGESSPECRLNRHTVCEVPMVAAVGSGHPLTGRDSVPLAELAQYSLITFHDSVGTSSDFGAACLRANVAPNFAFRATDPVVLARLAAEGLGVAVVPGPYVDAWPGTLSVCSIEPEVRGSLELIWRPDEQASTVTKEFIRHLALV